MTEEVKENTKKDDKENKQCRGSVKEEKEKKSSSRHNRGGEKIKPITKVIIRRLPPTMTEETFLRQIEPVPDYDVFYYVSADWSLGQNASCRAYINFLKAENIFIFKDKFDGYVFVDTKGVEYPAVVEYAPFQGLPKSRSRKKDNKMNTIETDHHYTAFAESLNTDHNDGNKTETKLEFSYQFKDDKKITKTPLLEYIANKRQERRDDHKRRLNDKKKQHDERQKKKSSVAKAIPPSIQEQEESIILVDEDDIMVRTIKSRPLDRSRGGKKDRVFESKMNASSVTSNKSTPSVIEEGRKTYKEYQNERERKRAERRKQDKLEREQRRISDGVVANGSNREDRDRNRNRDRRDRDRDRNKDKEKDTKLETKSANDVVPVPETTLIPVPTTKSIQFQPQTPGQITQKRESPAKKEVKKYSEVRKERRARAASQNKIIDNLKTVELNSSIQPKEEVSDSQKRKTENQASCRKSESERLREKREADERAARRIRNKDRPSMAIYRPGKLRPKGDSGKESPDSGTDNNKIKNLSRRSSYKSDDSKEMFKKDEKLEDKSSGGLCADVPAFVPKCMSENMETSIGDLNIE